MEWFVIPMIFLSSGKTKPARVLTNIQSVGLTLNVPCYIFTINLWYKYRYGRNSETGLLQAERGPEFTKGCCRCILLWVRCCLDKRNLSHTYPGVWCILTTENESVAMMLECEMLVSYLQGLHFTILSDHKSLKKKINKIGSKGKGTLSLQLTRNACFE